MISNGVVISWIFVDDMWYIMDITLTEYLNVLKILNIDGSIKASTEKYTCNFIPSRFWQKAYILIEWNKIVIKWSIWHPKEKSQG